jgi:hypothetical protein
LEQVSEIFLPSKVEGVKKKYEEWNEKFSKMGNLIPMNKITP